MESLLGLLGAAQNGGGLLVVVMYLAFEIRTVRRDIDRHEKIYEHKAKGA